MMNYGRINVNLLPPELQPGPAVRYALLINTALISITLLVLILGLTTSLSRIGNMTRDIVEIKQVLAEGEPIKKQHESLSKLRDSIDNYGRLVALCSADYVAMPVLLDRLSRLVPEGVFLERITNQGTRRRGMETVISVQLRSSKPDIEQLRQTIVSFKKDPLFTESHLRTGDIEESALDDLMQRIGVNWAFSGPGVVDRQPNRNYAFEIVTRIPRDFEVEGLPVLFDQSPLYEVKMLAPPVLPVEGAASGDELGSGAEATARSQAGASGTADATVRSQSGATAAEGT
jgi:hypothetical protein